MPQEDISMPDPSIFDANLAPLSNEEIERRQAQLVPSIHFPEQPDMQMVTNMAYKAARATVGEIYANHEARHDDLTGLLNRKGFLEKVNELVGSGQKPSMIFADGNNIKAINEKLGYTAGDHAIIGSAEVLKRSIRPGDILARLGGDEFVIMLGENQEDEEPAVEENLREAQGVPTNLSPVEQRIQQETAAYLKTLPKEVTDLGFDIAVGWTPWAGDFETTKELSAERMKEVKKKIHAIKGQYRKVG